MGHQEEEGLAVGVAKTVGTAGTAETITTTGT